MRFIAKLHVLDVMDRVVVSGYVFDADDMTDPDHVPVEFAYEVPSYGRDTHLDWLTSALYSALTQMNTAAQRKV
jgi:hypothetical protein